MWWMLVSALTTFIRHCSGYTLQCSMAIKKNKRCKYFWERNEILPFYNLESLCYCFEYVCLVFNPDSQIIRGLDLLCLSFIITILSPSASIIFTSLFILFLFIWLFSSLPSIFIIIKFLVKSSTCNLLFVRSFCHFLFCL